MISLDSKGGFALYPSFVWLGPIKWQIVFRDIESEEWGLCDPAAQTIYIDSKLNKSAQQVTLVHECLHAMWVTFGWVDKGKINEEFIVSMLESPVLMFVQDNTELIKWLQEK